ncbi:MAG: hypothetical protein JW774_11245, partial [Candidatus Aureabacteria bacterium]|nr:hypothetical protein [Candidatus Auribacterota bacterium]
MNRIFSCHFLHYLITLSFISQSLVYGQSFITTDHAQIQHLAPKSITQAAKEESTSPAVPAIPKNFRQIIESDPRFAAAYADAPESIKTASSEEEQEKLFLEYLNSQLTSLIKTAEENEEKEIQQYRRVLLLFKKEERALAQLKRLAPKKERALSELYESNHQEAQAAYADFSHVRTSPTALTVSSFQEAFSVAMIIRDLTSSLLFTSKLPEKTLERQKILTRQRFIQLQKTKAVQSLPVIVTSIRKADEEEFKALALHGVTVKYTESSRVDYANELHSNSMKEYRKQTKPAEEAKPERKAQEKTPEQLVSLARKAFFSTYRTTMREGKLREQLQKIIQYQKEQSSIRVLYQRDINQMWAPLTDAINRTRATYETLYAHASASLRSAQEATAAFRESNDASERFLH